MTKEEKIDIVERLSQKFEAHPCFYIADASGLTVAQVNAFRQLCFRAGVDYGVYKNTLIHKALEKQGFKEDALFAALKGFSGILFSEEARNAPARVIREYRKTTENRPLLKVASIDGDLYVGDDHLKALSELKSRDEVVADIVAQLQQPASRVVSAILSGQDTIANLVKTLADREKTKD